MADLAKLVDELSALTVLEAAELSKLLEEKWGVSAAAPVTAASPVRLTPAEADSLTQAILKDRADTEQWLKSGETSYLATVQRVDFGGKPSLTVGRDQDNDVCIPGPTVSPHPSKKG